MEQINTNTGGLEVSQGSNQGEAAFLGGSSFDPISEAAMAGANKRKAKLKEAEQIEKDAALLSEKVKAEWDTDVYNYFMPKVEELKKNIISKFREKGGVLSPIERAEFRQAWDELHNEALVSNKTYEAYAKQAELLSKDKDGVYNKEQSLRNLSIFKDPTLNEETKRELNEVYGGNRMKWRAANAEKYGLVNAFNENKYYDDITQNEVAQPYQRRDKKGNIIYEPLKNGAYGFYEGKRLTKDQVSALTNTVWSGDRWQDKEAQKRAYSYVDNVFSIGKDGSISYRGDLSEQDMVLAKNIINRVNSKTSTDLRKDLAKAYTSEKASTKKGEGETIRVLGKPSSNSNSNNIGGGDPKRRFNVTYSNYVVNEEGKTSNVFKDDARNKLGLVGKNNGTEKIIRRASVAEIGKPESSPYAIQLTVSGKPARPIAFNIDDSTGKVEMVASINEEVGKDPTTRNPIYKDNVLSVPLTQDLWGDLAAYYGFEGDNGVEDFKRKFLKMEDKQDISRFSGKNSKTNTTSSISSFDKRK